MMLDTCDCKVCKSHVPRSDTDASVAEMHMEDSRCVSLVEKTAAALNEDAVALMLIAVQRGNLELSVRTALSR